jgi:hypothetical protein
VVFLRTDKQNTFIDQYCLHGNAAKAAQLAGYSQDCVPGALSQLKSLSEGAESESVRLGAVKDILDRAGLKPTEKIKQEVSHVEEKSTEELQRELEALVGPLN